MHILIVEDEPMVARRIERLTREILRRHTPQIERADHVDEASRKIDGGAFDLVFLDLELHGADGYELLRSSTAGAFHTIVVSAHTHRALEAFEYGVLDFVGKPFDRARLAKALGRLTSQGGRSEQGARYLAVRKEGRVELIPVRDVRYVEGAGSYVRLHLRDGDSELHGKPLHQLVKVLPETFERIHRSYIARMDEVARFHAHEGSRYEVELSDGTLLPVGRTRYRAIRARFEVPGESEDQ